MRVLVADDDPDSLVTLGLLLRSEGFEVRLLRGGAEVPAAVRNFAPDVVLLDIAMPDRGGYDIAEELWGRYGDRGAILVAVSARTIDREHHFNHVVSKPYDPSDLITLLASYNGRIR